MTNVAPVTSADAAGAGSVFPSASAMSVEVNVLLCHTGRVKERAHMRS
jgi:hypothetical protein